MFASTLCGLLFAWQNVVVPADAMLASSFVADPLVEAFASKTTTNHFVVTEDRDIPLKVRTPTPPKSCSEVHANPAYESTDSSTSYVDAQLPEPSVTHATDHSSVGAGTSDAGTSETTTASGLTRRNTKTNLYHFEAPQSSADADNASTNLLMRNGDVISTPAEATTETSRLNTLV